MNNDIKYPKEYYNIILNKIVSILKVDKKNISPRVFLLWRAGIKRLFLKDFLIEEIVEAIPDAITKKIFPISWGLIKKIENICLLNRNLKFRGVYSSSSYPSLRRSSSENPKSLGELLKNYTHIFK